MAKIDERTYLEAITSKGILLNSSDMLREVAQEYRYKKDFILDVIDTYSEFDDVNSALNLYKDLIKKLREDADIIKKITEILLRNNYLDKKYEIGVPEEIKTEYLALSVMNKYETVQNMQKFVRLILKDIGNMCAFSNDILLSELFWLTVIKKCEKDMFEDISNVIPQELLNNHQFIVDVAYVRGEILPELVSIIEYNDDKEVMVGAISSCPDNYKYISTSLECDTDILKALSFILIDNLKIAKRNIIKNETALMEMIEYTKGDVIPLLNITDITNKDVIIKSFECGYVSEWIVDESLFEDEEFVKRLIETDSSAFNELPYSVQSNADILLYACKIYGQDLYVPFDKEYFDKFDKKFIKQLIEYGVDVYDEDYPKWLLKDRELLLKLVGKNKYTYQMLPDKIRCDEELTLEAVKCYTSANDYLKSNYHNKQFFDKIPESIRLNKKILLEILKLGAPAWLIPQSMRNDEELAIATMKLDMGEERFFAIDLKTDVDKMFDLFGENASTLQGIYWEKATLSDEQIEKIKNIVKVTPSAVLSLPFEFPNYKKIYEEALKSDPYFMAKQELSYSFGLNTMLYSRYHNVVEKIGIKADKLLKLTNTNVVVNLK